MKLVGTQRKPAIIAIFHGKQIGKEKYDVHKAGRILFFFVSL